MPIIGWDLGRGSGELAEELAPSKALRQIRLFGVTQSPGELPGVPDPGKLYATYGDLPVFDAVSYIDVFNLDPRLTIIPTFYHQVMMNRPAGAFPDTNLPATVSARALVRSGNPAEPERELYTLDPSSLFVSSGALPNGCEIASGMQGIRFRVDVSMSALQVQHDIVATLVAIPNIAFGCAELARDVIRRLEVRIPSPLEFYAYTSP
jgi:hypothetical protein